MSNPDKAARRAARAEFVAGKSARTAAKAAAKAAEKARRAKYVAEMRDNLPAAGDNIETAAGKKARRLEIKRLFAQYDV